MKATRRHLIVQPLPLPSIQNGVHLVARHHPSAVAAVIAIGPEIASEWPELSPGDRVAIKPMGGQDFEHRGFRLKRMTADDVLAVIYGDREETPNLTAT